MPPASLTKIMTSYIAAREIESGRIHLVDDVPISVNAWKHAAPEEKQSAMFIREGTTVKLEDLLRGVIIQSGNDATVADVAVYGDVAYAEEGAIDLSPYANVKAWMARVEKLPGFKKYEDVLPKQDAA